MRLETYAMDYEDLILFALLHNIREGFYIDVGANDPMNNSVTKIFYDRGWSGINIEPLRSKCKLLEECRPRDLNLCVGLGSEFGEAILYEIPELDMLSTFSEEIARESARNMVLNNPQIDYSTRGDLIQARSVQIMTLTDIARIYAPDQIHFCKIDVEGFEREVLLGVEDWNEFRPWIFCIESVTPTVGSPSHENWESILISHGYRFLFEYGMNRFYLDSRKNHLSKNFGEIREFLSQAEIWRIEPKLLVIT